MIVLDISGLQKTISVLLLKGTSNNLFFFSFAALASDIIGVLPPNGAARNNRSPFWINYF